MRETDFGPPARVRLCVYLDDGITVADADRLLRSWDSEAPKYGLSVEPVCAGRLHRDGFFYWQIAEQLRRTAIPDSCDRMLYFVNRGPADFAYAVLAAAAGLPEVLGYVDDATLTRGFVVARFGSLNQIVLTPAVITRHELYHLLGCGGHFDMPSCYRNLRALKLAAAELAENEYFGRLGEEPIFPTFHDGGPLLLTRRSQVNSGASTSVPCDAAVR